MEFNFTTLLILSFLMFSVAVLYSSVGHGGASGYLAVMALFSFAPEMMKPIALSLNILVTSIATIKYYRADQFLWQLFWPFAVTSVPFAFIGGGLKLPGDIYRDVVGFILLFTAYQLFKTSSWKEPSDYSYRGTSILLSLLIGAGIGLLSGLTGVGGGIFLSPLLVFLKWAEFCRISGIVAAFILINSISGLLGHWTVVRTLPEPTLFFALAVVVGSIIGSELGSRRLTSPFLKRLLALVLIIAGVKFIFS